MSRKEEIVPTACHVELIWEKEKDPQGTDESRRLLGLSGRQGKQGVGVGPASVPTTLSFSQARRGRKGKET